MNKYAHLAPPKQDTAHRRCLTKARYPSRAAADAAMEKLAALGRQLAPYRCPMCLGWHHMRTEAR